MRRMSTCRAGTAWRQWATSVFSFPFVWHPYLHSYIHSITRSFGTKITSSPAPYKILPHHRGVHMMKPVRPSLPGTWILSTHAQGRQAVEDQSPISSTSGRTDHRSATKPRLRPKNLSWCTTLETPINIIFSSFTVHLAKSLYSNVKLLVKKLWCPGAPVRVRHRTEIEIEMKIRRWRIRVAGKNSAHRDA